VPIKKNNFSNKKLDKICHQKNMRKNKKGENNGF
jgi:hypothetical protein